MIEEKAVNDIHSIMGTVKVITIERNHKRREAFHRYFNDIKYEFVIDLDMTTSYLENDFVSDLPASFFEKYDLDKNYCSKWSKGQLGCFATEKRIIKNFNDNNNLTILLDDAVPENNWKKKMIKSYDSLPYGWDALILGTRLGNEKKRFLRFFIHFKRILENLIFKSDRILTKKYNNYLDKRLGGINGIFGIIYSQNGIEKMINEPEKLRKDQDDVLISRLSRTSYLNVYIAYPQIVKEGEYDGSWTQKNFFQKTKV